MDNTTTPEPDTQVQATPTASDPRSGAEDVAARTRISQQAAQIAKLAVGVAEQRRDLKQLQDTVLDRLGDMDEDRRLTTAQLQRALLNHRTLLDRRLRHWRTLMFATLVVVLIGIALALTLAYRQLDTQRQALAERVERIAAIQGRPSGDPQSDALVQRELDALSVTIEQLARELRAAPAPAPAPAPTTTAEPAITPPAPARPSASLTDSVALNETQQPLRLTRQSLPPAPVTPSLPTVIETDETTTPTIVETTPPATEPEPPAPSSVSAEPETQPAEPTPVQAETIAPTPAAEVAPDAPTEAATTETPETPATQPALDDNAPIITLDAPSYAIQLLGAFSRDGLETFIREQDLPDRLYWRQETYQGKPWYVLIHSLYPTRAEAVTARKALPEGIRGLDIWVRSLGVGVDVKTINTRN
ncbi:hypothetical protein MARPU_12175 [Marichromatium purpuratum 984]|uniref:SPOR domain-containing protein n=1 Tax=Marichromatium purpuratum 984 TaxID=765910 RepID=W0E3Y5_MARPU|nr:hypothetical protein [Marichromatium purpuratum]AHF05575.1 hypothetical protein MARPU_12175 [Marichromatium purpuratum 984]